MSREPETISLDEPNYNRAIQIITAATAAATQAAGGDPQPTVRAMAFVLSLYLDADQALATNKAIRERGEEVGKVRRQPGSLDARQPRASGRAHAPSHHARDDRAADVDLDQLTLCRHLSISGGHDHLAASGVPVTPRQRV